MVTPVYTRYLPAEATEKTISLEELQPVFTIGSYLLKL